MTLAYAGYRLQTFLTHQGSTYHTMAYIWFGAMAEYARSIAPENADIMQHGGIMYEIHVYIEASRFRHSDSLAGHHLRMCQKQIEEG